MVRRPQLADRPEPQALHPSFRPGVSDRGAASIDLLRSQGLSLQKLLAASLESLRLLFPEGFRVYAQPALVKTGACPK